jgi:hypothetical protein
MKKVLLSSLLATSIFAFAYTQTDVSNANFLAEKGIVTKQSNETRYRLDDTITRAEVVAIALKIKWIQEPTWYKCKKYFSDTVQNDWVCRAVEIAADNGLVSKGNKKFRPQDKITRAETLAMLVPQASTENLAFITNEWNEWQRNVLYKYLNYTEIYVKFYSQSPLSDGTKIYPDYSNFTNWWVAQIQWSPNKNATRAEVFGFARNILTYTKKSSWNSSITFEDAWAVYAELVKYMKNKDINGINTLSYNPIEDMTDCLADCQEMMDFMIKNTLERFLWQKERFKFVYSDSKQIILSTGIIKVTAEETFWGSSGYLINSLLFAKDNSGKLKFINFGGAEYYGDGYTESGLIDTDNDGIIDKDEECENLADKYSWKCIKTDPKNSDTNNDGWWDGIEKAMKSL